MYTVVHPFTTHNQRFTPGMPIVVTQADSPAAFIRLLEMGYIAEAVTTADPSAVLSDPPATEPPAG